MFKSPYNKTDWQVSSYFFLLFVTILFTITPSLADDADIIYTRRVQSIIASNYNPELAIKWGNELTSDGNWTDVDYTAGCPARRANWPAQAHFHRIITMASSWNQDQSDLNLLEKISLALDHWFDRDFHEDDCINAGGVDGLNCPCGTPGLWNTNWYDQMILMPGLVGNACLLLKSNLTPSQFSNCTAQTSRAYVRIEGDPNGMMGAMTGANFLDVSSIGVSLALLTSNQDLLTEAVNRFYQECQLTTGSADGIKVDGSFMQHRNQLYTGNYGQVFMRNMLKIFMETVDTSLLPPQSVQTAFLTVINGSEWFMYLKNDDNEGKSELSWQYSAIGRMVSHKYEDWHGIGLSLSEILEGTKDWDNYGDFEKIVQRLRSEESGVNPGALIGTRFFHTSDFLVHRGLSYIVTLKMFSSRTSNSECNNGQNPFGFHLSDGAIYTHLKGDEYTNAFGAWDWNLIPGTTIDFDATILKCSAVQFKGKEPFVGGVALGNSGIGVMNYTNPSTSSLNWLKTYFFAPNSYTVQFVGNPISSNVSAPVYTTLDQRQRSGPIYIDGVMMDITEPEGTMVRQTATTLWHDRVGYLFVYPVELTVDTRVRESDWEEIGISVGNETQTLVATYFEHPREPTDDRKFTYTAYLDIDLEEFQTLSHLRSKSQLSQVPSFGVMEIGAVALVRGTYYGYDNDIGLDDRVISLVFLTAGEYDTNLEDITRVETDAPILLVFQRKDEGWKLAVADPSQQLQKVEIRVTLNTITVPVDLNVELPTGPWAGSTTVVEF